MKDSPTVALADGVSVPLARLARLAAQRAEVLMADGRTGSLFYVRDRGKRFAVGRAVVSCRGAYIKVPFSELRLVDR